ncbi:MAG: hypothetical protein A2Y15_06600 [Clostridiales bacterium GWF2_36_10]|nr:MAG: hypothetical protein A2Y15_06600 [Clostridiales bacterium GWF2_36_10]HAN20620.1 hypothetical protein [Clostridiales bacterium]
MTLYESMKWTNLQLIKGRVFTQEEKQKITKHFLDGVSDEKTVLRFHKGVNAPRDETGDSRQMYPLFFIPPYRNEADGTKGEKYKTITCVTPKTHILSANAYELEIIRILALLSPNNEKVEKIVNRTLERLKTSCFANECYMGECFETSLISLRFICTACPENVQWLKNLVNKISKHIDDKKRHSGILFYYWLCFSEMPIELAESKIIRYKDELLKHINRSFVMNSEQNKNMSYLCKYIVRNCLSKLDDYAFLQNRDPYINEKDGRLYFPVEKQKT